MDDSTVIGLAGLVLAGLTYFAGVYHGKGRSSEQQAHARELQEKDHALQRDLAAATRRAESIDRVVASFVQLIRNNQSGGIYAVADSGIATLGSHVDACEALRRMQLEVGHDPVKGQRAELEGKDLVRFFRYVKEKGLNLSQVSVEQILQKMRADGVNPEVQT